MNQNIKNAVDQLWANLGLPTRSVKEQIDLMWEDLDLLTASVVGQAPPKEEVPAVTESVPKPTVSKVIGHVPTRVCAVETCQRDFVPRHPKHDMCRECATRHFRALRAAEERAEEAAAKPSTEQFLRAALIERYKRGTLIEGTDYHKKGAQVILFGQVLDATRKPVKKSFTYFDAELAKNLKAVSTKKSEVIKSPEQLRKERIEAARQEAKNLRTSAEATAVKAKELSDAETLAKLCAETEDSEAALEAYCDAADTARKAWNEADVLTVKAQAAEQKLADLINPPPPESKSAQKKNGKEDKKNGGNGKSRDRHAS